MKITLTIHETIEKDITEALRDRAYALENYAFGVEQQSGISESWKKTACQGSRDRAARLRELATVIEEGDDY